MYLTPNQVYKKYGYHPKTLARWADEGKIKSTRSPADFSRHLQRGRRLCNIIR